MRRLLFLCAGLWSALSPLAGAELLQAPEKVMVIPVQGEVARPLLYVVRRGLKEAIETGVGTVVLDVNTPGGAMNATLEIIEALQKYPGDTIAFIDDEAMSAGAFISAAADEIYFAPHSVIGAAAPVTAGGGDISETMKAKLVSYMKGKMRAISDSKGHRGEVISAMIDADYELKIGNTVIKPPGSLLTLTAEEASATYGDPPQALLAAGIALDVPTLLKQKFGDRPYTVERLSVTWAERVAVWINQISPLLMGLGLLALFVEFKTPGFGIFGLAGIGLLGIFFIGHFVAGFSGHEPMLVFVLGMLLLGVEIFFFPGVAVMAVAGAVLMLGALIWSMADLWPNKPLRLSGDLFLDPMINVALGLGVAVCGAIALMRFLPRGWFWDKMILHTSLGHVAPALGDVSTPSALVGRIGVAATDMFPSGQVEIDGRRREARVDVGSIRVGQKVVVRGESKFGLLVERVSGAEGSEEGGS